jgi:hypothetical protein
MKYAKIKSRYDDFLEDLTEGELYEIKKEETANSGDPGFWITDDTGYDIFIVEKGCVFLGGGDWEIVEVP